MGIRVPKDVRIVGVDDDKYASLVTTPLTTIRQPGRALGAAAVSMMLGRIENRKMPARTLLLDCTLVVRESCGAAGKHRGGEREAGIPHATANRPNRISHGGAAPPSLPANGQQVRRRSDEKESAAGGATKKVIAPRRSPCRHGP